MIIFQEFDDFSNLFSGKICENPIAINAILIKTVIGKPWWANLVCWIWESLQLYTCLNCICSEDNDNLALKTNLAHLYQSSLPCRVHAIDECMLCWYPRFCFLDTKFSSDHHICICCLMALKLHNLIRNVQETVVWSFVEFFGAVSKLYPTKICAIRLYCNRGIFGKSSYSTLSQASKVTQ